jgi:SecD/SecF fusion protein
MNRNTGWKLLIIVVLIGLSVWKLYPPAKTINLGLDLKGGMHLVLQVDLLKYFENKASNTDEAFQDYLKTVKEQMTKITAELPTVLLDEAEKKNIELSKYFSDYLPDEKIKPNFKIIEAFWADALDAPNKAQEIIRRRVDAFGVSEPLIQTQGKNRILVQLPGIKEKERAKALLGKMAIMEFRIVSDDNQKTLEAMKGTPPPGYELLYEKREGASLPLLVKKRPELTGASLKSASPTLGQYGEPIISFNLDAKGGKIFALTTEQNLNKRLAIVLDNEVLMAPVIKSAITGGSGVIEGRFTQTEAQDIANVLNAGALPAPVEIIEERTVSPTLGTDSIKKGIISGLVGLFLVVAFIAVYYLKSGLIADFALCLNILLTLAAMAWFKATLTLPGIAGLILTIGMAVDANVLINERIREESALGKKIGAAISAGYDKAFITILDANLTTLFAALIMFIFGVGPIRGFAVTLSIGLIISMFTAITVTRTILDFLVDNKGLTKLPMMQMIKLTKIDFIKYKNWAYIISIIVIAAGIAGAVMKGKNCLGVDFTGGKLVQVQFDKPIGIEKIRQSLTAIGLDASYIQAFGTKDFIIKSEKGSVQKIEEQLRASLPEDSFKVMREEDVGPIVGKRLSQQAIIAILLSFVAMIIYITYRYDLTYALAGTVAIAHDAAVTIALCILTGRQLSLAIVAAVLTIIGYSINDTIVIYDRIREDKKLMPKMPLKDLVNTAINQTLSRTILTSFTVFMVLLALFLFGGEVIHDFMFAMLVGTVSGTYSTVYIATALVIEKKKAKK